MQDLSLHILDITENALSAGATTVKISLSVDTDSDSMILSISDNGTGMDEGTVNSVLSPFTTTRTTRNVGLGLPMLAQSAEATGGKLEIDSVEGKGTSVKADFNMSHIDLIPIGDLKETLMTLIIGNCETEFIFQYTKNGKSYCLDTRVFREKFSFKQFYTPEMMRALRNEITEGINSNQAERRFVNS